MGWRRFRALPNATVKVTPEDGHWAVWHTTVPAGGTHVTVWRRRSKDAALRKANKVAALVGEAERRAKPSWTIVVKEGSAR